MVDTTTMFSVVPITKEYSLGSPCLISNLKALNTVNMGNGSSASNKNGTLKETMGDHEESINCMALSEDSSMLVTG